MRLFGLVLSFFACACSAQSALAEEGRVIWESAVPTARVISTDQGGTVSIPCFATKRQMSDKKIYVRNIECSGRAAGYSDIAMPANSKFNHAMEHDTDPRRARVLANGMIELRR